MEKMIWPEFKLLLDSVKPAIYCTKEDSNFINIFTSLDGAFIDCDIPKSSSDYTEFQATYRSKLNLENWQLEANNRVIQQTTISDSTDPSNSIEIDGTKSLKTKVILDGQGIQNSLLVSTTALEAKAGVSTLSNRKLLTVFNSSNSTIYWGYTDSVTTSTGTPIFKDQLVEWAIGSNLKIYLIAASGSNLVRITEAS